MVNNTPEQKSTNQEIRTFEFLKQVISDNGGDENWQTVTLDQYHQDEGTIKMQFSVMALNFLTHEKIELLKQNQVWSAPYGSFYIWQFAINGLQYMKGDHKDGLDIAIKLLEPLAVDLANNLDYDSFNHFGRMLAIFKFNVYCTNSDSHKMHQVYEALHGLYRSIRDHRHKILPKASSGEMPDLDDDEIKACEMSIFVLKNWFGWHHSAQGYFLESDKEKQAEWVTEDINEALRFVEKLKSEISEGDHIKLFTDIEKDFNDMLEHVQPKEELTAEDMMSQLEAVMNQIKEQDPEAYAEMNEQAKKIVESNEGSEEETGGGSLKQDADMLIQNLNDEFSKEMWQAGRYISFHEWFGDYPEGTPNYDNLHKNLIPNYKRAKDYFYNGAIAGQVSYEDFAKQLNESLSGYSIEGGDYTAEEVETLMCDMIPYPSTGSEQFSLIKHYPELIYQCGVVSASFSNGCNCSSAPEEVVRCCERWGFVMTNKIEIFNEIAIKVLKNFRDGL